MAFNIEAFIFYLLLADSIIANIISLCCKQWYKKKFRLMARTFPLAQGWCLVYLVLVLWVGSVLWRLGVLPW